MPSSGTDSARRVSGCSTLESSRTGATTAVADSVEWVNRIYTGSRPWQLQESLHPNYWGVVAAREALADLLRR